MSESDQRRFLRFKPDEFEIAQLQFTEARPDELFFETEAVGLVLEEAYGGCALAMVRKLLPDTLAEGTRFQIKVATLGPMKAEVRWIRHLDEDVSKLGIQYVDAD